METQTDGQPDCNNCWYNNCLLSPQRHQSCEMHCHACSCTSMWQLHKIWTWSYQIYQQNNLSIRPFCCHLDLENRPRPPNLWWCESLMDVIIMQSFKDLSEIISEKANVKVLRWQAAYQKISIIDWWPAAEKHINFLNSVLPVTKSMLYEQPYKV